jgi:methionyl aminopeptidase
MTYVKAQEGTEGRTGQIKLHGPEGFAAMRKAGQVTAEALDLLVPLVRPGVTTDELDRAIAASPNRSAPRSTTSSVMAFPMRSRCARAISSIST